MPDSLAYHQARAAQERALAFACTDEEASRRHMDLANRHADKARWIREGWMGRRPKVADDGLSTAIKQSRALIEHSQRILAESRRNMP